jgi:hypothetical protein
MVRKGCNMLKGLLVIASLLFCAGALFSAPPTAQDAAKWKGVILHGASHLGRSALSAVLRALPSSGEVAHYISGTGWLPEQQPAPVWISHDDIECAPDAELPRPWCDPRVQAVLRLLEEDRVRRGESAPVCREPQPTPPALRQ